MFGLNFLYPLFLAGAIAVAIPIARLRELILLALRAAALLLLAVAFARPYIADSAAVAAAPVTVVALDTSLSLSAPKQFEAARAAAVRAAQSAPAVHAVSLLTFADSATVLVPPTTDRGAIASAVAAASATAGGTRYRTALARAAEVVGTRKGRIVVVTDMQQVGWEAGDEGTMPDGIELEVVEIPAPDGNLAVTATRREPNGVVAAVHNYGTRPVRTRARLIVDGREAASQAVDIAPQAAADVRLTAALPPRGQAEVRIDDADGYQGDNRRFLVLDPPRAVTLFVVTADPPSSSNTGLYVERALAVADEGRAFDPRVIDGRAFSALSDAEFAEPAGIILLGTRTLERQGRVRIANYLRSGGRVLLTLGPDTDLETLADTVGVPLDVEPAPSDGRRNATLIAVDGRHPIFRPFLNPTGALGDVYIEEYRRLKEQDGRAVLARFSGGGSALTEETIEKGRLLVFASDLDNRWNRFPLNPAFVPWALETARYLSAGRENRQSWILPEVPNGAKPEPGVQTVGPRSIAINPDVRESNPARTSAEEFAAAIPRTGELADTRTAAVAREQEEQQRLWQVGLLLMFLALAAEGVVGRKAT
jgi:hypothetical protein